MSGPQTPQAAGRRVKPVGCAPQEERRSHARGEAGGEGAGEPVRGRLAQKTLLSVTYVLKMQI